VAYQVHNASTQVVLILKYFYSVLMASLCFSYIIAELTLVTLCELAGQLWPWWGKCPTSLCVEKNTCFRWQNRYTCSGSLAL